MTHEGATRHPDTAIPVSGVLTTSSSTTFLAKNHRTMKLSSFSLALSITLSSAVDTSLAFAFIGGQKTAHHVTPSSWSTSSSPTSSSSPTTRLFGILDEIEGDSYDLLGNSGADDAKDKQQQRSMSDAFEVFLGELVFSPNDPRVDIVENFDLACDPQFTDWLNKKVDAATDPEEKAALRDLYGMIIDVKRKVEINAMAEERAAKEKEEAEAKRVAAIDAEVEAGKAMSDTDVLRRAQAIDSAGIETEIKTQAEEKKTFYDTELTPEIRLSYEDLLKEVLPPYKPGDTAISIAYAYYDKFDAQFVKVLTERSNNGDNDAQLLIDALAVEQSNRIAAATETLKSVLAMGEPMRMEGAIVKLAREGKVDEPFLLLLEANANQAEAAGAQGPAQLMRKLGQRAMAEKDKQSSSKEIKLLRQLLREDDSTKREQILEEAFTPKEALIVPGTAENARKAIDGELPNEEEKPQPEVPPPDFINACKAVLLNFGNLSSDDERGDLASRIKLLASEAEVVATKIYGKGMSAREQQDRAWSEQTTSIFDLERLEIEAERMGETAPWAEGASEDILPGFDADGKMSVGG